MVADSDHDTTTTYALILRMPNFEFSECLRISHAAEQMLPALALMDDAKIRLSRISRSWLRWLNSTRAEVGQIYSR